MQVDVAPPPLSVQVVKDPDRVLLMPTVPVGVIGVPGLESFTVTVQVVPVPARTELGEHPTDRLVVRKLTVILVVPVTPFCQRVLDRV